MRTLLFALLFTVAAPALAGTPLPDGPHIVVYGEGKASAEPDTVLVAVSARGRNADSATAKREVDRSVDLLLQALPGFDITPDDVTASDLQLYERVDYAEDDRPLAPVHVASRQVKVKLRKPARLGELVDTALGSGFNNVDETTFASSRETALRNEARNLAVAEAREKAAGLANAFGATLGHVYSIDSVTATRGQGYGNTQLDRITVTGSRHGSGEYLQPKVDYSERVAVVFELLRPHDPKP